VSEMDQGKATGSPSAEIVTPAPIAARKCEIFAQSRTLDGSAFGAAAIFMVCRTHGVTIEGYQSGPLCFVGRLERVEALLDAHDAALSAAKGET
jgi:hypothetical protein